MTAHVSMPLDDLKKLIEAVPNLPELDDAVRCLQNGVSEAEYRHELDDFIEQARSKTDTELEIDDDPNTSEAIADGGCWVSAWVWVANDEVNRCTECGAKTGDGEGYDDKCGGCAEKVCSRCEIPFDENHPRADAIDGEENDLCIICADAVSEPSPFG